MMKIGLKTTLGVFALGLGATTAWAGPPSIDRPSPPPCCADGICYPNPTTWGHYGTRWRRWPTDYLEPLPPEAMPPAALPADIQPFETPPPEEEDRRAPPPSAPHAPPTSEDAPPTPPQGMPADGAPATPPVRPTTPATPPTSLPFGEPDSDEPPTSDSPFNITPPPTTLPFGGEPPTTLPFGEPMGDADPPPAPPFLLPGRGPAPVSHIPVRSAGFADRPVTQPISLTLALVDKVQ